MKTGILTFNRTLNYGAELQAFALRVAIQRHCPEVEMVDYQCDAVTRRERPRNPSARHIARHPISAVREARDVPSRVTRASKFDRFAAENFSFGPHMSGQAEIASAYDSVVVGSDQVWNLSCTGGDASYFLDDVRHGVTRKISYAASFGSASVPRDRAAKIGEALRDFDAISVREAAGVGIVRELSGRDAVQVLDPTLLLTCEEWAAFGGEARREGGYVFAYVVSERKNTLRFAREASEREGLPLVVVDCYGAPKRSERGLYANDASPEEFLALVRDASLVVTSSFHGLALSLALGTEVRYSLDTKRANANSRLEDLARLAGIEDHGISEGLCCGSIDFDAAWGRLDKKRDESRRFLSDALR